MNKEFNFKEEYDDIDFTFTHYISSGRLGSTILPKTITQIFEDSLSLKSLNKIDPLKEFEKSINRLIEKEFTGFNGKKLPKKIIKAHKKYEDKYRSNNTM